MDNYTLYVHVNKTNGKRYVGITSVNVSQRWRNGNGYRRQRRFFSAIKHYGWDGFDHIVLESGLTKEEAERREEETIREYKANNPLYGYNIENGGVIRKLTEEQKEHLRQMNIGRKFTPEARRKLREAHAGKKLSDETKQKMSEGRKGPKNVRAAAVDQYDLDGNFLAHYDCMEEARSAIGVTQSAHISRCCSGKRHKAYGYIWRHASDGK